MIDDEEYATLVRQLVEAELRYYGYTDEQIALAMVDDPHTDRCEFVGMDWQCEGEDGKANHLEWDEAHHVGGVIGRAVEAVWPLVAAAERQRVAGKIRNHAAKIATRAESEAGVATGAADAHPLLLGLEFAARVAEDGS